MITVQTQCCELFKFFLIKRVDVFTNEMVVRVHLLARGWGAPRKTKNWKSYVQIEK